MAKSLIADGASEGVIMEIGGWKTRDVFERYNIKSQAAKAKAVLNREASEKVAEEQKIAAVSHSEHALDPQKAGVGHVGFTLEPETSTRSIQ